MSSDRYVLLIAIGPVQPFIASARKIRDLWAGSTMLQEMAKAVARALHKQGCNEVEHFVFPSPGKLPDEFEEGSDFSVANKILVLTPEGSDPQSLAEIAREAFQDYLTREFNRLEEELCKEFGDDELAKCVDIARLKGQSTDYGEFYAVWTLCRKEVGPEEAPVSDSAERQTAYSEAIEEAERLLAGRKMFRAFTRPGWAQKTGDKGLPKCSLDGARETVLASVSEQSPLVKRAVVKKNEHLDALSLLKRWKGLKAKGFELQTLSALALMPYRLGMAKAGKGPELEDAENAIRSLTGGDGELNELLFKDRLDAWLLEKGLSRSDPRAKKAGEALKRLYEETCEPPAYTCVLKGDGDHMGRVLADLKRFEHHKEFSKSLRLFVRQVRDVVKEHSGTLIYCGGDDLLSFLPLHTALDCAAALSRKFGETMEGALKRIAGKDAKPPELVPSLSIGMVIVHHLDALDGAIATVRRAEEEAKERYSRNSLAIIQSIRGGGEIMVGGPWCDRPPRMNAAELPVGRLKALVELCRQDEAPNRLAHQLKAVAKTLGETRVRSETSDFAGASDEARRSLYLQAAVAAEAKRIVMAKEAKEEVKRLLVEQLSYCGDLEVFANGLLIAQQIACASRIAEGDFR